MLNTSVMEEHPLILIQLKFNNYSKFISKILELLVKMFFVKFKKVVGLSLDNF